MLMNTQLDTVSHYTAENHQTWAALYARQMPLVMAHGCRLFLDGLPKLGLDPQRVPAQQTFSERLHGLTGWTLADAQNEYLGATEWFEHLLAHRFPVTSYIRQPHELEFTPLPDLFHEYFGHLAFFTDQYFADTAHMFSPLYLAGDERQRVEVQRLWWFTTEFGLIRENGALKIIGAGLLSSPGELNRALDPATPHYPFDVRRVAETPLAAYSYHDGYFVLDDVPHIRRILEDYARVEGLPMPRAEHSS